MVERGGWGGGGCWWEGSWRGLPHSITVGLLLAMASPHKHTHTHKTHRRSSGSIPITFQICLDQCRASCPKPLGHSWTWDVWEARGAKPDKPQLPSPPEHHHAAPSSSPHLPTRAAYPLKHLQRAAGLWRTALRASPITQRSGQAAGVTAHMSQHDQGVRRHACPLTFPTARVQAESESRGGERLLPL